ncbi:SurA N-terminal domain-containing protein [Virgibacillus kekensis]|uniref:SurA N-terminal domain-containing protein n=1 Tax=Virgibacillus kekensis TaxID=202261 RepID=A0ABV9DNJ7_9BACI
MKKAVLFIMTLALLTILAACGEDAAKGDDKNNEKQQDQQEQQQQQQQPPKVEVTDKEKVKEDKVVVSVNGTDITGKKYNSVYAQTKMMMSQYGQDVSDTKKIKDMTISALVEQEILKQDAKDKGIKVTEEEVQSAFEKDKSSTKGDFNKVLEQNHFTEESYKEQVELRLIVEKYANETLDIKVTDKEVQDYYDKILEQQEKAPEEQKQEVPKLKELEDQIRQQLKVQEEQKLLQKRVNELKDKAEIKTMI